jgi:hypothetical protein
MLVEEVFSHQENYFITLGDQSNITPQPDTENGKAFETTARAISSRKIVESENEPDDRLLFDFLNLFE